MRTRKLKLSELNPYHKNARRGDVDAIADSLQINGQYKPIVVNEGTKTGRPWEILVGNHTAQAAGQIGFDKLDAVVVDVDDEQARKIVLADNRTSDFATYDDALLADLLRDVDSLDGTGFTEADLEGLLAGFEPASDDEWSEGFEKIPEGEQEYFTVTFSLTAAQRERLDAALAAAGEGGDTEGNRNAALLDRIVTAYTS